MSEPPAAPTRGPRQRNPTPQAVNPSSRCQITTAVAGAKIQTSEPAGRDGSLLPRSSIPEEQGGEEAAAGPTGEFSVF